MSKISKEKREQIMANIMATLYEKNPRSLFTSDIAKLQARDEEFIKKLLFDLKKKGFVVEINKNPKGIPYVRRIRWKLSDKAYGVYKASQF